jgi:hypothetical protein
LWQLLEYHRCLAAADVQRRFEQVLQPVAEGGDPAFPATAVAATGNGILNRLWCGSEAFATGPLQQSVEEGAGVGATRETMNIGATRDHFTRRVRIKAFIIEELLRLRALRRLVIADAQAIANAQGTV